MEGDLININEWLRPLSWLYGAGVWVRNFLFDSKVLKETAFPTPVICVGNITAGGTGKTPHTEMLLRMLGDLFPTRPLAVLSRGYKRSSRGFVMAAADTSMRQIGDEPWQMKQKFPGAIIAVDANRRHGINEILRKAKTTDSADSPIIILDDAYQHRYVKAGLNILLTDYHRLITDDSLLPAGRLREQVSGKDRAHIVIVSKCPEKMTPIEFRVVRKSLHLKPFQRLFFSQLHYGALRPLFTKVEERTVVGAKSSTHEVMTKSEDITSETHVILLTGIASPEQMMMDIQKRTRHIIPLFFADHHEFTSSDVEKIERIFTSLQGSKRLIVTTEKDAARLQLVKDKLSTMVRRHVYVLPIEVRFMCDEEPEFRQMVASFINGQ